MLVSFTQTYGHRPILLDIYMRDERLIEFKNKMDLNIYSFHNASESVISKFKERNKVDNTKIFVFNNIKQSYTDTISYLKSFLKEVGCTHLFFSQDDSFSADNLDIDFDELVSFANEYDNSFCVNLAKSGNDSYMSSTIHKKTFSIYEYSTFDLVKNGMWAFDDTPYICTMDILEIIYDDNYLKKKNIWSAETYLSERFAIAKLPRWVPNKVMFRNYNIFGKSTNNKYVEIMNLRKRGLV